MDEETEALLAADFEIGHFFRDRIIPRAVLYFTGEALEDDEDDYEEEEDEDGIYEGICLRHRISVHRGLAVRPIFSYCLLGLEWNEF